MARTTLAFTTPADAPRWKRLVLYAPLARIVIFIALAGLFAFAGTALADFALGVGTRVRQLLAPVLSYTLPVVLAYFMLARVIERRPIGELAPRKLVPHTLLGVILGAALFSAVIGILGALGAYHIDGMRSGVDWLAGIVLLGLVPAIGEEIICRGVLFRVVEEGLGTWIALIISALVFGLGHIGNPNATLMSAFAIAVEAGILFGMLYHVTRSLYLCIGLHAAWNVMQGTVYGVPVSGIAPKGFLIARLDGPTWLSGGAFGAEASVVALACCLAVAAPFFIMARRNQSIVPPFWCRPAVRAA